jgi:phosphate uptake regulator
MAQTAILEDAAKLRGNIHQMCQQTIEMLTLIWEGFRTHDVTLLQQAESLGPQIHQQEKTLTASAVQQGGMRAVLQELLLKPVDLERQRLDQQIRQPEKTPTASAGQPAQWPEGGQGIFLVPVHLERIGDNLELMVRALKTVLQEGIPFTERAVKELNTLFAKAIELLEGVRDVIATQNPLLIRSLRTEGHHYRELVDEYVLFHQQRLIEGVCLPKASSIFVALLDYLKGIEGHINQITDKLSAGRDNQWSEKLR